MSHCIKISLRVFLYDGDGGYVNSCSRDTNGGRLIAVAMVIMAVVVVVVVVMSMTT